MKGFGNLVKEAQKLQAQLEALKEEVGKKKVEASAGGGMVVVEANGNQELLAARIDREVITPDGSRCWRTSCWPRPTRRSERRASWWRARCPASPAVSARSSPA